MPVINGIKQLIKLNQPATKQLHSYRGYNKASSSAYFKTHKPQINNNPNCFFPFQIEQEQKRYIRARFRRAPQDPKQLQDEQCLIPLSIGQQDYQYGPYFAATLKLAEETFSGLVFIGCDTLQRYNRAIQTNQKPEDCCDVTRQEWAQWIEHNYQVLANLSINWSIIRWDNLLEDSSFPKHRNFVQKLYEVDDQFRDICHNNIELFLDRMESRDEMKVDREKAWHHSLSYLLEECAAMFIWKKHGHCKFELYPTNRSPAMQYVWQNFFEPHELIPVALDFHHLKNYEQPKNIDNTPANHSTAASNKFN